MSTDATVILAENSPKDSFQQAKLENLSETNLEIFAIDKIPEGAPSAIIENLNAKSQSGTGGFVHYLCLKKGSRVMLTVNIDLNDRLRNGQLDNVDNIVFTESGISKIYLKFDVLFVGKQLMRSDFYSNTHQVVANNRVESHISLTRKNNLHMISRTQVSIMLAYTCTIHKVQGLTTPNTVVVLDLKKQKSFNYGHLHVALSRAKSFIGLTIVGSLKKAHPNVIKEHERLRRDSNAFIDKGSDSSKKLITLLNIRFVCKHLAYFFPDERLNQSSIICLRAQINSKVCLHCTTKIILSAFIVRHLMGLCL